MEDSFNIPDNYKVFEELHDRQISHVWAPPSSSVFMKDIGDWNQLYIKSKIRVKAITYALSQSEPEVMANIADIDEMMKHILQPQDVRDMSIVFILLGFQNAMEGIHVRSYHIIDQVLTLDKDIDFRTRFMPFIEEKVKCIGKWRGRDYRDKPLNIQKKLLTKALVANVCAEGITFNSLFSIPQYLRSQGILTGMASVNEEVRIDEASHCITGAKLYNVLVSLGMIPALAQEELVEIVDEFVRVDDIAIEYIFKDMDESERRDFMHMNAENSKVYTRILANTILESLGGNKHYPYTNSDNAYKFTNDALIHELTSFFDKQSAQYGLDVDNSVEYESDFED